MKLRNRLNLTLTDLWLAQLRRLQKRSKANSMTCVVYDLLSAIDAKAATQQALMAGLKEII